MSQDTIVEVDRIMKSLLEKDLRIQCRARGLSPAGNREVLRDRLKQHMLETEDFSLRNESGEKVDANLPVVAGTAADSDSMRNNFSRPGGQQNVGNFLTGRNSSRVIQAPGGTSSITFG